MPTNAFHDTPASTEHHTRREMRSPGPAGSAKKIRGGGATRLLLFSSESESIELLLRCWCCLLRFGTAIKEPSQPDIEGSASSTASVPADQLRPCRERKVVSELLCSSRIFVCVKRAFSLQKSNVKRCVSRRLWTSKRPDGREMGNSCRDHSCTYANHDSRCKLSTQRKHRPSAA